MMKTTIKQITIAFVLMVAVLTAKTQVYIPYDSCFYIDGYGTADESIYAMSIVNDTLIIGGGFYEAGGISANLIAQWDGKHFHAMGLGNTNTDVVRDAIYFHNLTYIVGGFNSMGNVPHTQVAAYWDGNNYHALSLESFTGIPDFYSICAWHDTLFIGGTNTIGGNTYVGIVGYYNGNYIDLGTLAEKAWDVEVYNDKVYAVAWYSLYEYDPAINDFNVVADFDNYPEYMIVDTINNFLYVAGGFVWAGNLNSSVYTDNVAIWNGFYWENIGSGINGTSYVKAIELYRGDVYIGGASVDTLSGTYVSNLARWDGQQWHMVGPYPGVTGIQVEKIKAYKDTLYVGGSGLTPMVGNDTVNGLFRFYMPPDTTCKYLQPRVFTDNNVDTFYLSSGSVAVQLYNNNAYVQSWQWDFDDGGSDTIKDPLHIFTDTGTYNVCVTVNDTGCIKTACKEITILSQTATLTMDVKPVDMKLYPNPTDGNFFVDIELPVSGKQAGIKVFGLKGTLKAKYQLHGGKNHIEIPSAEWKAGNYLICLVVGGKVVKSKYLTIAK